MKLQTLLVVAALSCSGVALCSEKAVAVGQFSLDGQEYETTLTLTKLHPQGSPYDVTLEEAKKLVVEFAEKIPGFEGEFQVTSITLLVFEEGQILQVLMSKKPLSFFGGSPGPMRYFYVTGGGEVIGPKLKVRDKEEKRSNE